jgi:hypothetical protein
MKLIDVTRVEGITKRGLPLIAWPLFATKDRVLESYWVEPESG